MSSRFFVEQPIESDRAELTGAEAHHAIHVMRCRIGDEWTLFDGRGAEFPSRVIEVGRACVRLRVLGRCEVDREAPRAVVLGVAIPKGDRQRWLIEKATELGVVEVVPLVTDRGVAQPVERARERLERAVIEASKQCGRNCLMRIALPQTLPAFCQATPPASLRLIAHVGGAALCNAFPQSDPLCVAIGPEGGFTDAEVAAALACGWQAVSLGSRTLRVETAALAVAALAQLGHGLAPPATLLDAT